MNGRRGKILFVSLQQYGYLTDMIFSTKYSAEKYDVEVVCWDYGFEKVHQTNVNVFYVSRQGSKIVRMARLLRAAAELIRSGRYQVVMVDYFLGCSLLRPVSLRQKMLLDVRTAHVGRNAIERFCYDSALWMESIFFQRVTVISEGVRTRLKLSLSKTSILPLGAEPMAYGKKEYSTLHLLYVGTFGNRRIEETIEAFYRFTDECSGRELHTYTIIGFGTAEEESAIRAVIEQHTERANVRLVGRVPYWKLKPFFEQCNVGVAYVPITGYYTHQPPTKVFEYLLSGMAVIGTQTAEMAKVITDRNGVLIKDDVQGFYDGLKNIHARRIGFDSESIATNARQFSWSRIIASNLIPVLERMISGKGAA